MSFLFPRLLALGVCLISAPASAAPPEACHADAASLLKLILATAGETPTGILVVPVTDGLGRVLVPAGSVVRGATLQRTAAGRIHFQWESLELPDGRRAALTPAVPEQGLPVFDEQGVPGLGAYAPGVRMLTYGAQIQLPDC